MLEVFKSNWYTSQVKIFKNWLFVGFFVWPNSSFLRIILSYCDARQKLDPLLPQSALSGYGSWTSRSVEVLECDVLKWRNGLSDLLTDEKGQQAFAKFLKSEYSGENLSFWLHTRRYRRAPSKTRYRPMLVTKLLSYFVANIDVANWYLIWNWS